MRHPNAVHQIDARPNGSTSSGNGTAASSPGGGGGGAYSTTATQHNGGAGGAGKLVITLANNVSFTPGNLVVERVGDGIESFSSSGDTIYMDEFTTSGSYVQNFKITDSGSSALIDGSAGSDGGMTLSADGRFLCMPGYNINQPYSSSLANAMGSAVPRGVGTVSAAGSYSFVVSSATVDSGNNIRGAATDGNGNYWASGGASGVDYLGTANSAANVYSANLRCVNIINNNLWYDTGSTSPGIGIWKYSGKPTTAVGNTATEIITITNTASTASPYNFAVDAAEDTIYYADDGSGSSETTANAGIHKWQKVNGTWTSQYILLSGTAVYGLTVDWTTTPATIYATTGSGVSANNLIKIQDTSSSATSTTLATAAPNTSFRNVAFAPISPTAGNNGPVCAGSQLTLSCTTVPGATYSWTGPNSFTSTAQNPTVDNSATTSESGAYTVTVKWNGGTYTTTASTTATVNALPSSTISAASTVCPDSTGNTASVPTTSGATYAWTISNGSIQGSTTGSSITYTAGDSGTVTLGCTVTSSAGCQSVGSATPSISSAVTTTAGNTGPYCSGSTIQLTASGGAGDTYSWTGPNSFTSTAQNPTIPNSTTAMSGSYSVTRTSGCGTSLASTTTVTVNQTPTTPSPTTGGAVCVGNTLSLFANTTADSYFWSGPNSFTSTAQNPTIANATTAAAGTYTLVVTVNGCTSSGGTVSATVNPLPSSTITAAGPVYANSTGNTASVPTSSGGTYAWTITGGTITAGAGTASITYTAGSSSYSITLGCTVTSSSGCSSSAGSATVQDILPFTAGNLAVNRIGNGMETLNANGDTIFIDEYSTAGTLAQSIKLPDSTSGAFIGSGSSGSEGALMRSPDGKLLCLAGYNTAYGGSTSVSGAMASAVPRAVGTLDVNGNFAIGATTTTQYGGNNFRGGATDGNNNFWGAGAGSGTYYLGTGTAVAVQTATMNTRVVNIVNGNLYLATGSATGNSGAGIYSFSGLPVATATPTAVILTGTGSSPYGFAINAAGTIAYVADDGTGTSENLAHAGIERWDYSGGTWSLTYTLGTGAAGIYGRGVTVDFSGANPVIYATTTESTANRLIKITDTGSGSTATTLATAPATTFFRGVTFTPKSSQTITPIATTATKTYGDSPYSVATTASSGLTVTYSSDNTSVATVDASGNVTIVGAGTAHITASQSGNNFWLAAASVQQTLTVSQATPTFNLSSSANPSGYKDSVTFTANGFAADVTGTVQFTTNGVNLGSAVTISSQSAVSIATAGLPRGDNPITAIYSGDNNYVSMTKNLTQTVTNHPPASKIHFLSVVENGSLSVPASTLAGLDYDADGDPLTITTVGSPSTNGVTVTFDGTTIGYTPPANYVGADQFTYTISDGQGGTATCTNAVTVRLANGTSVFTSMSTPVNNGATMSVTLRGYGIPGKHYDIQESSDPTFVNPAPTVVATVQAAANGVIAYTDTYPTSNDSRYYRFAATGN